MTECCFQDYLNRKSHNDSMLLNFFQQLGINATFLEKTIMFYGMYSNRIFGYSNAVDVSSVASSVSYGGNLSSGSVVEDLDDTHTTANHTFAAPYTSTPSSNVLKFGGIQFYYDLPLAYLGVNVAFLLISLVAIVKSVSREFKDRMVEGEGQFYQYCNLIFGGWDFCIHNEKSAHIKHKAVLNEIKGLIQSKRMEVERHNRPKDLMFKLIMIRLIVNMVVCIILIAAAFIIYVSFNQSIKQFNSHFMQQNETWTSGGERPTETATGYDQLNNSKAFMELLKNLTLEFLPYLTIVCMNLLAPLLFNYLVQFEQYSPMFVIKITLLRTVFLRLSSLAVLLSRFHYVITTKFEDRSIECTSNLGPLQCWETFVGQQFYKLLVVDFVTHVLVTFFINYPRAFLARHCNTKFTRFIGEQEFELSKHVLDIVYSQTICWLGTFYSPFIPATAAMLHFGMFYVKKFACLHNSKPSAILYRTSRSNSLFMLVLLLSFVLSVIPIVYSAAEIVPSRACGPFRGLNSVWDAAITAFLKLPIYCQQIIFFFGTASFAVPCFVGLILCLYYYYAVSVANKHMVEMLKNQLVLEGHDKQFLLNRLSAFLKQQQEYQRKMEQHSAIPPQPPPRENRN